MSTTGGFVTPTRLERVVGLCLLIGMAWGAVLAWTAYDRLVFPHRRTITTLPSRRPPGVRADDPAEVRRWQEVLDSLGAAATYREAKRQDWADAALQRALELDPENADARAMQARWRIEPAPTMTPEEHGARSREARVVELLGAAVTLLEARRPEAAERVLQQVLTLDPGNPTVQELLESRIEIE